MGRFRKLFKTKYDIEISSLDQKFKEYDLNSLDLVELFLYVEDEFQITISDEQAKKLVTFRDLFNFIELSYRTFQIGQEVSSRSTDEVYIVTGVHSLGYEITRICDITEHEANYFFERVNGKI